MNKTQRDRLFKLTLEGEKFELKKEMFEGLSKEKATEILHIYWNDDRRQAQEFSCQHKGKAECKGNCENCKYKKERPLSIDQMEEDGVPLPVADFSIEDYILQKEQHEALRAATGSLDERDRRIMELFSEGRSEEEIATEAGLKKSGVNYRKHKSFNKLHELLKDFE